jgi:IS605 OrfB family transposase
LSYGVADFADVKDLAEKISPVFVNQSNRNFVYLNRDEVRHGVGGLTANRIELLENLKRLVSRVMSKTEDKKVFVEAELMREKIFKKLNNVKRERFKVTASIILDKAMELKSQGKSVTLCLEDLENMKTDNRNRAWQNKKISSWYTSRIIKQLQELCAANGIKFAAVNAMHTSHKNENNEFTPRLAVFTPEVPYMKKKLEKQFNLWINKKDLTSRRDPSKLSEVYKVYKEAYVGYGVDSFEQLKLKVEIEPHLFHKWEGKPLVACQGGAYMYSPKFGVIDADQMAGLQIAREGILRCERIAAKKMPEVARTG